MNELFGFATSDFVLVLMDFELAGSPMAGRSNINVPS
jgi:hypothetical protein